MINFLESLSKRIGIGAIVARCEMFLLLETAYKLSSIPNTMQSCEQSFGVVSSSTIDFQIAHGLLLGLDSRIFDLNAKYEEPNLPLVFQAQYSCLTIRVTKYFSLFMETGF